MAARPNYSGVSSRPQPIVPAPSSPPPPPPPPQVNRAQNVSPYQNVAMRGVWNPCTCGCSLRTGCFIVAIILQVLANVETGMLAATPVDEKELSMLGIDPFPNCETILRAGPVKNETAYETCRQYPALRTVITVLGCFTFFLHFISSVLLLCASLMRTGSAAIFAGGLLIFAFLNIILEFQIRAWHLSKYPGGYSWDIQQLVIAAKTNEKWEEQVWGTHEFFAVIWALGLIFPIISSIQYGRQISAGQDLEIGPTEPLNTMPLNQPAAPQFTTSPYPYGVQNKVTAATAGSEISDDDSYEDPAKK